jgi:hypothetical protein
MVCLCMGVFCEWRNLMWSECAVGGFVVCGCVCLCVGIVWFFQTTRKLPLSALSQSRY